METTDISEFILSSAKVIKKSQSMLLMLQMYDWDSFLFLASQVYNARNGKSISALARQVSTKNELGKPYTPPIKNERETIHFETASRG